MEVFGGEGKMAATVLLKKGRQGCCGNRWWSIEGGDGGCVEGGAVF